MRTVSRGPGRPRPTGCGPRSTGSQTWLRVFDRPPATAWRTGRQPGGIVRACPVASSPPAEARISRCPLRRYPDGEEVQMAKTLIDVNEEYLAAAQEVLHTETKKDTINAALRAVAALAARRRDLQRLAAGGLPDLENTEVMRG